MYIYRVYLRYTDELKVVDCNLHLLLPYRRRNAGCRL